MENANYYENKMREYENQRKASEKEIEKYKKILKRTEELKKGLPNIKNKIDECLKEYQEGGYLNKGETFDKGVLKECSKKLGNDIEDLSELTTRYENKIRSLERERNSYINNYNASKGKYDEVKRKENEGE